MANTAFQFGFQPFQSASGVVPNFGFSRRVIAYNYATALYRGDPVALNSSGNVVVATSQSAPLLGIFWGCEYVTNVPLTALPVKSKYWPGVALSNSATVVTAWVIEDPDVLFLAAEVGTTAALTQANIGNNVQWVAGAGGNTATGISSYCIDDAHITTTITLPFQIVDLYSTTAPPGVNGSAASLYNWGIVKMNYTQRNYGSIGI